MNLSVLFTLAFYIWSLIILIVFNIKLTISYLKNDVEQMRVIVLCSALVALIVISVVKYII